MSTTAHKPIQNPGRAKPVVVVVLHEQPTGFEPHKGKEIGVGDAIYDPTTGVHTIARLDAPPRYRSGVAVPAFRRAHDNTTTWINPIFDDHTYLTRRAPRRTP